MIYLAKDTSKQIHAHATAYEMREHTSNSEFAIAIVKNSS